MEEALLVLCAMEMEQEEVLERKRLLRNLRDSSDPFSMSDTVFVQYFRLSKEVCNELIEELMPFDDQKTSLPFGLRFLHHFSSSPMDHTRNALGTVFGCNESAISVAITATHIGSYC